ncbi:MAG: asparaginase domain-containing protein [Lachnospiraceae bacterium]|nr:asparaginase domain-containing protein [Lachnospiraceae bacterium]
MRILIFLTGGTICSEYNGDVKVQGKTAGTVLEKNFNDSSSKFAGRVTFITTENYGIFSEDMTTDRWEKLIGIMREMPHFRDTAIRHGCCRALKGREIGSEENICDGIIIAHGTDTLAYSSALFSILLKNVGVPVFIVSSNESLEKKRANGCDNFRAAVECICKGIKPNVYVTYRNVSDGKMYLHYASRLTQCRNYEEDFTSVGMVGLEEDDRDFFSETSYINEKSDPLPIDIFDEPRLYDAVMRIDPYVGMNYDFYNFSGVKAILHGTYHSGTVCAGDISGRDRNSFFRLMNLSGDIPIFVAPSDLNGGIYETVDILEKYCKNNAPGKVRFINGFTNEMLYVKLLLAYSNEELIPDADRFVTCELNREIIKRNNTAETNDFC